MFIIKAGRKEEWEGSKIKRDKDQEEDRKQEEEMMKRNEEDEEEGKRWGGRR